MQEKLLDHFDVAWLAFAHAIPSATAGKFLIVAPNTPATLNELSSVRRRIDRWCLDKTFGETSSSMGIQGTGTGDRGDPARLLGLRSQPGLAGPGRSAQPRPHRSQWPHVGKEVTFGLGG